MSLAPLSTARVPTATYRLQLRKEFGFRAAAAIAPYLAELGVSHVYCSPVLQAAPGSAHGYDVVDHTRLNEELGGAAGWRALVDACAAAGLGIVVDVVPNHMALPTPERLNAAFWDLLANGRASAYADWFDIDWTQHGGRVLVPVLGRPLDECVRDREVVVDTDAGEVRYYDHAFPLAAGTSSLDEQHYLLADWRRGNTELNYRRFFDVTTLAGLRVELPAVFDATHALVAELVRSGDVQGLRIDHPDGLADPRAYLEALEKATGGVWTVVEKILEGDEQLPTTWACDGTTGYDAAGAVSRVLVDPSAEGAMTALYAELAGETADFASVVETGKRKAATELFGAEVSRLVRDLSAVLADQSLDGDAERFRPAIVELLVRFEVYRAYAGEPASRHHVEDAVAASRGALPDAGPELDLLARLLLREVPGDAAARFATRFEQTTGPVTAKGVEDTAFYRYLRFVALNEVGGDPARFGAEVADFHRFCGRLAADWPATMTTLSTHDTKRSEDVRARLFALAEIPAEWAEAVRGWRAAASRHGDIDPPTGYLFWQTLVGAHPIDAARLDAYLLKAAKEAKLHTSWIDPDDGYEARLSAFVHAALGDAELMARVGAWVEEHLAAAGRSNSLAQKLLQLTMPGVPDVYQGQELPDFSLVDPDNRRPVDYDERSRQLHELTGADPKLRVTASTLRLRRERPASFAAGYQPISAAGAGAAHVIAFRRGDDVVAVSTRLPITLNRAGGWRDTTLALPPGSWRDVLTDRPVTSGRVGDVLDVMPVALLVREDAT